MLVCLSSALSFKVADVLVRVAGWAGSGWCCVFVCRLHPLKSCYHTHTHTQSLCSCRLPGNTPYTTHSHDLPTAALCLLCSSLAFQASPCLSFSPPLWPFVYCWRSLWCVTALAWSHPVLFRSNRKTTTTGGKGTEPCGYFSAQLKLA